MAQFPSNLTGKVVILKQESLFNEFRAHEHPFRVVKTSFLENRLYGEWLRFGGESWVPSEDVARLATEDEVIAALSAREEAGIDG